MAHASFFSVLYFFIRKLCMLKVLSVHLSAPCLAFLACRREEGEGGTGRERKGGREGVGKGEEQRVSCEQRGPAAEP